jgi:predicted dehydrogenase
MVRLGLIGAGGMAGVYADRTADMNDATIAGVASPNSASSFVADHAPSATAYPDAEALCSSGDVDAVAVLTPTDTHQEMVDVAADHGLAVICEKPLARTVEGARAIADTVTEAGIPFMTAHVVRFFPEYAAAKERVDAGAVGDPGVVRTRRAFGFPGDRGWFDEFERSGGALLDLAVHDFDYLRWAFGPVERVFTRRADWEAAGHSDVALTTVRHESGVVGHVEVYTVEVPGVPFTTSFEVAGTEGLIEFDLDDVEPFKRYGEEGVHVPRDPVGDDLPLRRDGYRRQLDHFVECVESGADPRVGVAEGAASMRVSLGAIESARRGVPVAPGEVDA